MVTCLFGNFRKCAWATLLLVLGFAGLQVTVPAAWAALPPHVKAMLDAKAGGFLTLDLVIGRAVVRSDQFRSVRSEAQNTDAPLYLARSLVEPRFKIGADKSDDEREPLIVFSPARTKSTRSYLGVSSAFITGTELGLELSHGSTDIRFGAGTSVPPFGTNETRALVTVKQSLLNNFFGAGVRGALDSGELSSQARKLNVQAAEEDWVFELIQSYYAAWFSQAQVNAATDNVERRERLRQITKTKLNRGTAEEPDYLQTEAAVVNAQVTSERALQGLWDQWRALVLTLKLPDDWLAVNPRDIPLKLDEPFSVAEQLCRTGQETNKQSVSERYAHALHASATAAERKASWAYKPNLDLKGALAANAVDAKASQTFGETFRADHPYWSIGLELSFPLTFAAERAAHMDAKQNLIRAEALATVAAGNQRLAWLNGCSDFNRLNKAAQSLARAYQAQKRRAALEEARFKIGRTGVFAVIQAGDDTTGAEIELRKVEVDRRLAAWRVVRLVDGITDYTKKLEAQFAQELQE